MTVLDDWSVLQGLFPSDWLELAKSSGAVRRLRGFASVDALLHTLLLHVGCGWSLRETCVQAKLAGIADVSDVALFNRLRSSEDWLRQMCEALLRRTVFPCSRVLQDEDCGCWMPRLSVSLARRAASGGFTTVSVCPPWSVTIST